MKKISKKIIALVCMFSMMTMLMGTVPIVQAENDASPEGLASLTWNDFGITEESTISHNAANWGVTDKSLTGKKVINSSFRGRLCFHQTESNAMWFQYGGETITGATNGIRFTLLGAGDENAGKIRVFDMTNGGILLDTIDPRTAGLTAGTSFNGTEFELGIDLWQPSSDSNDLKMNLFINGTQYNETAYTLSGGAAHISNSFDMMVGGASDSIELTAETEDDEKELTSITWKDLGIDEGTYSYTNGGFSKVATAASFSLKNTSFRGDITFTSAGVLGDNGLGTGLVYGDNRDGWQLGLNFIPLSDGTLKLINTTDGWKVYDMLDPAKAGLTSFVGDKFELGIDSRVDGDDIKFDILINGTKYNTEAYTWKNGTKSPHCYDYLTVGFVVKGQTDQITVAEPTEAVEEEPGNLTELGWENFGIAENKTCEATGDAAVVSTKPVNLTNASFSGNVKFNRAQKEDAMILSFASTGWNGIRMTQADDTLVFYGISPDGTSAVTLGTVTKEQAQVADFSNQKLELRLAIWQSGDDYKINVRINGIKVTEVPMTWADGAKNAVLQNSLAYYVTGDSAIDLIVTEDEVDDEPKDLTSVTWKDLGLDEGEHTYTNGGFSKVATSAGLSLKNTSFRGEIKFTSTGAVNEAGLGTGLIYGDNSEGWQLGLNFIPLADGTLKLMNPSDGFKVYEILDPAKAGLTSFVGEKFELGIDSWESGDNLRFNVYINGTKYNAQAYTWKGGAKSQFCYDYLTVGLLVKEQTDKITVIYPEIEKEASPEGLKAITWADLSIGNQKYTSADAVNVSGLIVTSNSTVPNLLNTSFLGKITFHKQASDGNLLVCYGSTGWDWNGIRISVTEEGKLRFQGIDTVTQSYPVMVDIAPENVGAQSFNGEMIELRIDIWEADADAKINIFVNGVQCTKRAYVWKDAVKNQCIGNGSNLVVEKPGDSLEMKSVLSGFGESIQPDASLKEISFSSFGVKDGVYACKHPDLAAKGGFFDPAMGQTLNGTLLNGDVRFSGEAAVEIRYGGLNNAWEGLVLRASGRKLLLVDTTGLLYTFVPEFAGVDLTDNTVNLKISLNYVDSDSDGVTDDVKLGFWFNDVLYKNEFIYLTDYTEKLGSKLGIYVPEGNATLALTSRQVDNSIDFALFGFTKDFKQYLKATGKAKEIITRLK